MLSEAERARGLRFASATHRRRHEAAHATLRQLLAAETGIGASGLAFEAGWCGKPALAPGGAVPGSFNLSHSDEVALLLWDPEGGAWGVDVECLRPIDDRDAISERVFTMDERAELATQALRGWPADPLFLRLWVRKEACLKALGTGFSLEPGGFHVGLDLPRMNLPVRIDLPPEVQAQVGPDATLVVVDLEAGPDVAAAAALWLEGPRPGARR